MSRKSKYLQFNTAIITYPSDYNGLLTAQVILDFYKSKCLTPSTKLVIAQEDPDEEIQRTHFHLYWDDKIQRKQISTSYFDIPLEYPVVVFIHSDKTREYAILSELESQLGWDNGEEMVAKLDEYCKENGFIDNQILNVAHPNIQLRKDYIGSKYEMLRYVVKQKLLFRTGEVKVDEELEWLLECKEELEERLDELIKEVLILQENVLTVDELILLIDELKQKRERALRNPSNNKKKRGRKPKKAWNEETLRFLEKLRNLVLEKRATKSEILSIIYKDKDYWNVFASNYLNYNKLINDLFKNRAPSKPKRDYSRKFWLPVKLYDKIVWLDDWVRRWTLGETMEQRPKGLVLIGPSRTGKTSLISLLGDFSYFKNIWNVDNWESLAPFTVMDDMDAGDEGKGLSFCWYKPFFGAQDAITVTDKFKPKQDIVNGKPLVWINNYDYKETFQSKTAQDYIEKNMDIVYIDQPLFEKPVPFEWIEGHSDYIEWDPKTTWYYQNVFYKEEKEKEKKREHLDFDFVDETAKVIETFDENEPLQQRKERIEIEKESGVALTTTMETTAGRPIKRIRTEN